MNACANSRKPQLKTKPICAVVNGWHAYALGGINQVTHIDKNTCCASREIGASGCEGSEPRNLEDCCDMQATQINSATGFTVNAVETCIRFDQGFGVMEWLQTKRPHRHVRGRLLRRVRNADSPKKSPRSFAIPDTNIPAANFQCRRRALFPKPIHHKMVIPRLRRGPKHWLLSLVESDCGSPQIF